MRTTARHQTQVTTVKHHSQQNNCQTSYPGEQLPDILLPRKVTLRHPVAPHALKAKLLFAQMVFLWKGLLDIAN